MDTQQQKQFKILLVGETCEDEYVYGTVDRISPEAPVPILNYERMETSLGMSANVKKNLESFGVFVNHITNKDLIKKKRIVDSATHQQLMRIDEGNKVNPIRPLEVKTAFLHFLYDAVVISDYDKGFLTEEDLKVFCKNYSGPVFIDTKKKNLFTEPNVIFKINQKEYDNLVIKPEPQHLIITKGSTGSSYMNILYESEKVNVFDVVGAGDTFLSALVYSFLLYKNHPARIDSSIRFANKAAAISVQHYGCYTLTENDIEGLK